MGEKMMPDSKKTILNYPTILLSLFGRLALGRGDLMVLTEEEGKRLIIYVIPGLLPIPVIGSRPHSVTIR